MYEKYHEEFEYIFIDDGSTDNTLNVLKRNKINYISFSLSFGKETGLYAGLKASKGDYVAVIDVDLQDSPELLDSMYKCLQDGEYENLSVERSCCRVSVIDLCNILFVRSAIVLQRYSRSVYVQNVS